MMWYRYSDRRIFFNNFVSVSYLLSDFSIQMFLIKDRFLARRQDKVVGEINDLIKGLLTEFRKVLCCIHLSGTPGGTETWIES